MFMLEMSWKSRFRYLSYCCSVRKYILVPVHKVQSQKYSRKYAPLLSHDFRNFTSLGE